MDEIRVVRATPSRWSDVETLFGRRGGPSWCWCQFFVTTGSSYEQSASANKAALRDLVGRRPPTAEAGAPAGLLAYREDEPVGWLQLGPVGAFPRVTGNRARSKVVDETSKALWRVTCFVVPPAYRRQGIATRLLREGISYARSRGAQVIEGHPVDTADAKRPSADLYHGVLTTFLEAGFAETGRTGPRRAIVRLDL